MRIVHILNKFEALLSIGLDLCAIFDSGGDKMFNCIMKFWKHIPFFEDSVMLTDKNFSTLLILVIAHHCLV